MTQLVLPPPLDSKTLTAGDCSPINDTIGATIRLVTAVEVSGYDLTRSTGDISPINNSVGDTTRRVTAIVIK